MLSYVQETPRGNGKASRPQPEKSRGTTIKISLERSRATMRGIARAGLIVMGLRSDADIAAFSRWLGYDFVQSVADYMQTHGVPEMVLAAKGVQFSG